MRVWWERLKVASHTRPFNGKRDFAFSLHSIAATTQDLQCVDVQRSPASRNRSAGTLQQGNWGSHAPSITMRTEALHRAAYAHNHNGGDGCSHSTNHVHLGVHPDNNNSSHPSPMQPHALLTTTTTTTWCTLPMQPQAAQVTNRRHCPAATTTRWGDHNDGSNTTMVGAAAGESYS